MQVLKFGGSSVANAQNINRIIEILKNNTNTKIVVVSALGGTTDLLIECANKALTNSEECKALLLELETRHLAVVKELLPIASQSSLLSTVKKICNEIEDICNGISLLGELSLRTIDKIISYGELLSSQIIAAKCNADNLPANWLDARAYIKTDSNFGNAVVQFAPTNQLIQNYFSKNAAKLTIVPGFVASDVNNNTTTLGRGGSDYTAAIFAAAVNATHLEIWTDVSGMMTADPRLVTNVKVIPEISYQEAMELSHFGAKVIYPPTIHPVMHLNIPVWVKNTFQPNDNGTVIKNIVQASKNAVTGISSINKISLVSLEGSGMAGIPGFSKRLFEALANHKINVILISQSSSEHSICVGIDSSNAVAAKTVIDNAFAYEIEIKKVEPLIVENNLAIVALVGDNMQNHTGIAGKMFNTLGKNGINIRAIAQGSSERNISAIINVKDVGKAVNVLHESFFESVYKQVHLFIAGVGNVGGKLLAQLQSQVGFLKETYKTNIKIIGLANSKQVALHDSGIDLNEWKNILQNAPLQDLAYYVQEMISRNLRNTIFVDVSANEKVASVYHELLQKAIAVVACNKIACSSSFAYYKTLKSLSKDYNTPFLFETNVGAGLPIIGTLKDLISSGDTIHKMQGVLSGTLNYVFNHYDGTKSFATIVRQAQEEGYTEPDPRLDLSGKDVMRKIMILARECGAAIEMDDIANKSFMPESCMVGTVDDFYIAMEKEEAHFKNIYDAAQQHNCKLKFVATFENGEASVGLEHIPAAHDFYHLYGKDNIVLFYTNRYPEQPLVVKGAGAGAEVTASGVFADIIRATNK